MDWFSGLLGGGDSTGAAPAPAPAADPTSLVSPDALSQARWGGLGSMGALLMAAGQPGPYGQRAQMLAQMGNIPEQMNKSVMSAAQLKLMQGQLAKQKREQDAENAAKIALGDTSKLDPASKAWATADPTGYAKAQAQSAASFADWQKKHDVEQNDESDIETRARMAAEGLTQAGLPPDQAKSIGTGMVLGTHKIQQVEVPDMSIPGGKRTETRIVGPGVNMPLPGAAPAAAAAPAQPAGAPPGSTTVDPATGQPAAQPALSPAQAKILDRSTYPVGVAMSESTGGAAALKSGWNAIAGQFGADPFKKKAQADQFLTSMDTLTQNALNEEVPGRNTNAVRADLKEKHSVPLASFGTADPQALDKLQGRRDFVQQQLNDVNRKLAVPGALTPKEYQDLQSNKQQLERVVDMHNYAVTNFWKPQVDNNLKPFGGSAPASQPQARQTSSGISWSLAQ